ncbi:MAG: hypothetical protein O9327_10510 [Polaromonas sp.]|nr:hypothetical protein [Polaromonas sp.]
MNDIGLSPCTIEAAPSHLFDSADDWSTQPMKAFEALLVSDLFTASGKSPVLKEPRTGITSGTATVYRAMFGRFLRHLVARNTDLLTCTPTDIDAFLREDLAEQSQSTTGRYIRLVERVVEHLVIRGLRQVNPVAEWRRFSLREADLGAEAVAKDGGGLRAKVGRPNDDIDPVTPEEVSAVLNWVVKAGLHALDEHRWRDGRDLTIAALCLGFGLRGAEVVKLHRDQVTHQPSAPLVDRFSIQIPSWATARTAKSHSAMATAGGVELLDAWWRARWQALDESGRAPAGDQVFPSGMSGKPMSPSAIFKNLRRWSAAAVEQGILLERHVWVLATGAQGLRRAHLMAEIQRGTDQHLIAFKMGFWTRSSIAKSAKKLIDAPRIRRTAGGREAARLAASQGLY